MLNSLITALKPRQLEAIKHTQAPQLILAGAGTGKTTTMTAKIAYMVETEVIDPSHNMIEIAKKIAFDYEHGFERTNDERACEECGYRLYCGD